MHDDVVAGESQRLDKWLWHARFARTRTAAARLVTDGHVRLNTQRVTSSSKQVRSGDVLTVALGHEVRVVRLCAIAPRRGPPAAASALYERIEDGAP